jgi:cytochrome c
MFRKIRSLEHSTHPRQRVQIAAQLAVQYKEEVKNMKKLVIIGMIVMAMFGFSGNAFAIGKHGTAAEAEAMVKKAIALAKAKGKDTAFAEINNPAGQFAKGDLYVFVYDMNGKCVAHGQNAKMIGKELIDMKDADGKEFVKERVEIAKIKGSGWQDYKFTDPLTRLIEHKRAYVERHEDLVFGSGIYK